MEGEITGQGGQKGEIRRKRGERKEGMKER